MQHGANVTWSASKAGAQLFDEKIIESYRETISKISEKGVDSYISNHLRPFFDAAGAHFDASKKTWIETKLGGTTELTE